MPFEFIGNTSGPFLLKYATGSQNNAKIVVVLLDKPISPQEEKLLENLLKIAGKVYLATPEDSFEKMSQKSIVAISSLNHDRYFLIVSGKFAPVVVEDYNHFRNAEKVVFINPSYSTSIASKMSSFETPSLVLTATPGNLDHDPDAVKYHDLISGSRIQYVRGISGNPLFLKFTQSFNSIQRFLTDD